MYGDENVARGTVTDGLGPVTGVAVFGVRFAGSAGAIHSFLRTVINVPRVSVAIQSPEGEVLRIHNASSQGDSFISAAAVDYALLRHPRRSSTLLFQLSRGIATAAKRTVLWAVRRYLSRRILAK